MSIYAAQAGLQNDYGFQQRVQACVQKETSAWEEEPTKPVPVIAADIMPEVAASPGFAEKFLYGDQATGAVPGQLAVTDGEILSTVQPLLDEYRPVAAPPA